MFPLRTLTSFFVSTLVIATAATGCAAATDETSGASQGAASGGGYDSAKLSAAHIDIDEEVTITLEDGAAEQQKCVLDITHLSVSLPSAAAAAAINRVLVPNTSRFVSACQMRTGPSTLSETNRMVYNGAGVLSVKHDSLAKQRMIVGPDEGRTILTSVYQGEVFDLSSGQSLGLSDVFDAGGLRVIEQACTLEVASVFTDTAGSRCRTALAAPGKATFTFDQFQAHFYVPGLGLAEMKGIDVPWSALRGHVVHEGVKKVPSTASQPDICTAFPSCDVGDTKVGTSSSQCLQDIGCYERTTCGGTIWCSGGQ